MHAVIAIGVTGCTDLACWKAHGGARHNNEENAWNRS
jgi:hypothetical protein